MTLLRSSALGCCTPLGQAYQQITQSPLNATRLAADQGSSRETSYKGFPHGMPTTHAETINADLLAFIKS
jgi:hypothetical protein